MPERTSVTQVTQVGVETTSGTTVPANRRLSALSISPSVSANVDMFLPQGQKFHTVQSLNQEWVEADLEGKPTYTEIIYPLSSVLTTDTPTAGGGATPDGSYEWEFVPAIASNDTPTTFTVEKGSGVRAHRFAYGLVTELTIDISRDAIDLGGSMMGQILQDNVALTASPTAVALTPIVPSQVSIYLDNTAAALGTTKLTRVTSCSLTIGDRYNPAWFIDAAQPSWATHVEVAPTVTAEITMEADAEGMQLLGNLRDGATRFLRVEALGPEIATGVRNRFRFDLPAKVEDVGDFDDADGIYVISWTLRGVVDPVTNRSLAVSVRNNVAAL